MKQYYVYILTNKNNKVLYTGVTSDLVKRVWKHREKIVEGFTAKYNVNKLVHFEMTSDVHSAITREKQIKGWLRSKKIALIEKENPHWKDLSPKLFGDSSVASPACRQAGSLRMTKDAVILRSPKDDEGSQDRDSSVASLPQNDNLLPQVHGLRPTEKT